MSRPTRLLLWISILGIILFAVMLAAVVLVFWERESTSDTPLPLVIRLEGEIPDGPSQGDLVLDVRDFPPQLGEITQAIRKAATDDEVSSLVLDLRPLEIGWGGALEVSDALTFFRASEKPCTSFSEELSNKEYMVAASCGEIVMAPAGVVLVNGLYMTTTYFTGALDKLGIKADFEHVGDFKTAVEPMQRTGPSDAAMEASNEMLDSIFGIFLETTARGRGVAPADIRTQVDDPHLTPDLALGDGVIDRIASYGEIFEPDADTEFLHLSDYLAEMRQAWSKGPFVAVIHAEGTISSGDGDESVFGGGDGIYDKSLIRLIRKTRDDEDVKAVVLRVNSPGGGGLPSDNIWQELRRLQETKPLVVSMGDVAASGGYYIAVGADTIFADASTLTGSIGVFGGKLDLDGLYEKLGLTRYDYKRGEVADLFTGTQGFSEQGREKFREFLQGFYDLFVLRVSEGRGLTKDEVQAVAQGRVWTGAQAMENGLVDHLGGLDAAIDHARSLANLDADSGIQRLPLQESFFDLLMRDLSDPQGPDDMESRVLARLGLDPEPIVALRQLQQALGGQGLAAMLPFTMEIH